MKSFAVATILAIAAPALAQSYLDLPTCAQAPTLAALGSTGCTLTDIACVCRNSAFVGGLLQTIPAACTPADTASALTIATQLCAANGVTLSIPAGSLPSATSAVSTTTAVATTTSVVNTVTSVTRLTSSVPVVTSTPLLNSTSTVIFANSTTTLGSTSVVPVTTGTLTRQSTASRSTPATTSSAVPASGAVAQNAGLFGLIGGLALAMAGAL